MIKKWEVDYIFTRSKKLTDESNKINKGNAKLYLDGVGWKHIGCIERDQINLNLSEQEWKVVFSWFNYNKDKEWFDAEAYNKLNKQFNERV
ncbi:hypothetical protein [Cytobacillus praedii]|uniref:Uncharacterized protein n=1 Tax=Cytobacillus praedii TaxID=1742358 RepID=A0A4R1AT16_9BACI|nr:hypothetical protein [Cytobacillus praedii]TCI99990.1 hypothetical protein E0Y62_27070 [Cytobacillus praedii]